MSSFEGGTFGETVSPVEGQEESPVLMQQPEETQPEQQPSEGISRVRAASSRGRSSTSSVGVAPNALRRREAAKPLMRPRFWSG